MQITCLMRIFLRDELKEAGHPFYWGWKNKFYFGKRHKFIFNAYYTRCVEAYIRAFKKASTNDISFKKFILDSHSPNFIFILPFLSSFIVITLIFLKTGNVCKWTCYAFFFTCEFSRRLFHPEMFNWLFQSIVCYLWKI